MNLILLDHKPDPEVFEVTPHQAKHLLTVVKPAVGDLLKVGVLGGKHGVAKVHSMGSDWVKLEQLELNQESTPKLPVHLVMALPRPKVFRRVVKTVTALGVESLVFTHAARVEKSYWQSPQLDKTEHYAKEGLEQSRDTVLPRISFEKRFRPFVEDRLPALTAKRPGLLADMGAAHKPAKTTAGHTLVVGPEGGFVPFEVDLLMQNGCSAVHLGERVLYVETAVSFLIGSLYG